MKGILICGESNKGKTTSVSKELITAGKRLSRAMDQPLDFLLSGEDGEIAAGEASCLGVDRVLTVRDSSASDLHAERQVALLTQVCGHIDPMVVLLGQTDLGRDVAPRLAARMGANVCLDCEAVVYDREKKAFLLTKPVYGGNALAQWVSPMDRPLVTTIRPRSQQAAEPDPASQNQVEPIPIQFHEAEVRCQLLETTSSAGEGIKLEDAKVIVAGGGGIGGIEGFGLIRELADALGAAVGITRVPSDEKWMPKSLEIGQTGHVVSPGLYIAVGISGAPQHMAGCSGSKKIVAINKDPESPIFRMADIGIIGDYREILPPLIDEIKRLKE